MRLNTITTNAFVLLRSDWSARQANRFLLGANYTHVIVAHEEPGRFNLFTRQQAANALAAGRDGDASLRVVFDLENAAATPILDAAAEVPEDVDRVIMVRDGRAVGFFDAGVCAPEPSKYRSSKALERFEAYPALSAPPWVTTGQPFDFFVGFRSDLDRSVEGGGLIVLDQLGPDAVCELVLVCEGVAIDRPQGRIPFEKDIVVRFTGAPQPGRTEILLKAEFSYDGQRIATAQRTVPVGPAPDPPRPRSNPCRRSVPEMEQQDIDLTVCITHGRDDRLRWTFCAPYPPLPAAAPVVTELVNARGFAAQLIRDFKGNDQTGPFAAMTLRNKGQEIFRLMPPEFLDHLHRVRDALNRPPRLLVLTNEAHVPWELALLDRPLDEKVPAFLACQTPMSRWLDDEYVMLPPAATLECRRLIAVAARYGLGTDQRELKEALAEQLGLQTAWKAVPLKAELKELVTLIDGQPQADFVHFAVHGVSDPLLNDESLLLADKSRLRAEALVGDYHCGQTPRLAFVFLNACQVGTAGTSFGQAAGFPGILVRGGARGFIAPLWEVDDTAARCFAEAFYQATLGGRVPVAEVLQAQRQTYQSGGPTTPLAYLYYGHPALKLDYRVP